MRRMDKIDRRGGSNPDSARGRPDLRRKSGRPLPRRMDGAAGHCGGQGADVLFERSDLRVSFFVRRASSPTEHGAAMQQVRRKAHNGLAKGKAGHRRSSTYPSLSAWKGWESATMSLECAQVLR